MQKGDAMQKKKKKYSKSNWIESDVQSDLHFDISWFFPD